MSKLLDRVLSFLGISGEVNDQEYYERFLKPELQRGVDAGIEPAFVALLASKAIREADMQTTFPRMLLRDYIDKWIADYDIGDNQ